MDCEVLPASLAEADNCISITNPFYPLYGTLYGTEANTGGTPSLRVSALIPDLDLRVHS